MRFDLTVARESELAFHDYFFYQMYFYGNTNDEILMEVVRRIAQSKRIVSDVIHLLEQAESGTPSSEQHDLFLDIEIRVESFYLVAWNTIILMEEHYKLMVKQKNIAPCFNKLRNKIVGVRTVRNKLIEHSYEKDGMIWGGLKLGDPHGPVLKFVEGYYELLDKNVTHPDIGLFANAHEFYTKLKHYAEQSSLQLKAKGARLYFRKDGET